MERKYKRGAEAHRFQRGRLSGVRVRAWGAGGCIRRGGAGFGGGQLNHIPKKSPVRAPSIVDAREGAAGVLHSPNHLTNHLINRGWGRYRWPAGCHDGETHGAVVVLGVGRLVVDELAVDAVEFGFQPLNSTSFNAAVSVLQSRETRIFPPSQWNCVVTG